MTGARSGRLSYAGFTLLIRTYILGVSSIDLRTCAVSVHFLDFYFLIWLCLSDDLAVPAQSMRRKQKKEVREVRRATLMLARAVLSMNRRRKFIKYERRYWTRMSLPADGEIGQDFKRLPSGIHLVIRSRLTTIV